MPSVISQPSLLEISIVDKGASGDGDDVPRIVIAKRDTVEKMMTLEDVLMSLPEDQKAVVMAALAEAAKPAEPMQQPEPEMPAKAEGEQPPPAPEKEDEEEPKMPMTVAKALEGVSKEDRAAVLEAIEKRQVLEKRVAELEADKELREFTEIAKSMDALPGMSTEQRAKVLIAAKKNLSAEDYSAVEKSLKDAATIVAKSLGEVGSEAKGATDESARLDEIAKSLRAAEPKLTLEQARIKAMQEHPDLYEARLNSK